jgi:hypothetical protein
MLMLHALVYCLKTFFERAGMTTWYSHKSMNCWVNVFNMASVVCCDVGKLLIGCWMHCTVQHGGQFLVVCVCVCVEKVQ